MSSHSPISIIKNLVSKYRESEQRIKIIDLFLLFQLLTGLVQMAYVTLVGTFPFNSFLAGFLACVGSFVLTGVFLAPRCSNIWSASLRMQVNNINKGEFHVTSERAFADYAFCNVVLFLVVLSFMG